MATTTKKTSSAKTAAPKSASKAKAAAAPATETLREQASQFRQKATDKARAAASSGKNKASEAIEGTSSVIEDLAATLDDKLGQQYGDYARKAASSVNDIADKLKSKEVEDLLDDAREFVRKRPVVTIGVAAAIGFALTRLIKAGSDDED